MNSLKPIATADEAAKAVGALLAAVAAAEITPAEAEGVSKRVGTFMKALETSELERRIAALEKGITK